MSARTRKYVIVPEDNVFNEGMQTTSFQLFRQIHQRLFGPGGVAMTASHEQGAIPGAQAPTRPPLRILETDAGRIRLIDSIGVNEASLVRMTPDQAFVLQRAYPGLRIRPELRLVPLRYGQFDIIRQQARPATFRSLRSLALRCVDAVTGRPVADAHVVIVLNRKRGLGISGVATDAQGWLRTPLPAGQASLDAIICAPLAGYWPGGQVDVAVAPSGETVVTLPLTPIAVDFRDGLDRMLAPASKGDGRGVRVAVIDTGTDPAPGLNLRAGLNTTGTEPADEWFDNGAGHGTHVAGIIARVAPEAELHAYRVFEKDSDGASEFAIARAIRQAVDDGCDIINLSLGQSSEPIAISREVRRARAMGALCVAAAGNGGMAPVSYPARSAVVLAISAGGVLGAWPAGAITGRSIADDPAPLGGLFFASFSNIGPEMDFIGPGVGIISWVNAGAKGVMDGTSMASPAVAGLIARMLSHAPAIRSAARSQQRSDDIVRLANAQAQPVGFGRQYEGAGLIRG